MFGCSCQGMVKKKIKQSYAVRLIREADLGSVGGVWSPRPTLWFNVLYTRYLFKSNNCSRRHTAFKTTSFH